MINSWDYGIKFYEQRLAVVFFRLVRSVRQKSDEPAKNYWSRNVVFSHRCDPVEISSRVQHGNESAVFHEMFLIVFLCVRLFAV
jgi:hypothetical protein